MRLRSLSGAQKFGFKVKLAHLGKKFFDIVKNPRFGHGKNMNPCIDCRLIMIDEVKHYLDMAGGDFIITGEVLGQRPMSQTSLTRSIWSPENVVSMADWCARLSGRLLAADTARKRRENQTRMAAQYRGAFPPTPNELAEEFGLTNYPSPASGCLLTDKRYSDRLRDLLKFSVNPEFNDLNLLRVGRHFRLGPNTKLVVGRDEPENLAIESLALSADSILEVVDIKSPIGLIRGEISSEDLAMAASLVARYSDGKKESELKVEIRAGGQSRILETSPALDLFIEKIRI